MLAPTALRTAARASAHQRAVLASPRLARSYAQEGGPAAQEPINQERGPSRTPFYIGAALVVLIGGYFSGVFATPPTPAVKNMQVAMHPKTADAKMAAGIREDPKDEPHKAGGDLKGRSPTR
ncbi:hypothetical protein Rt10032_c17g5802 [Rhodotorula toruloides]|uniref:Uncharacterized protein n=1 Tax=Rhodotorula toruloides TaxID=5286 RepID=A0A511KPC3_RHOTO|nr:hypothetical protein Rt10032_c17g5802 [Rhodotorula toruloides]